MTDLEYHQLVIAAASAAYESETSPVRRGYFLDLKREAKLRADRAAFGQPLVFILDAPGYVTIGEQGAERSYPRPDLAGLEHAWIIFINGLAGNSFLHASTILDRPGKQPGNALRNSLAKAAAWIERECRCAALAAAMRAPSLQVQEDGSIRYNPNRHARIKLNF